MADTPHSSSSFMNAALVRIRSQRHTFLSRILIAVVAGGFAASPSTSFAQIAADAKPKATSDVQWRRIDLSRDFYSEGGAVADIDKDGHQDLIAGPFIHFGPTFESKTTFYQIKPFSINGYSNNFFAFSHDIDRDGFQDIVVYGFPGAEGFWYRNPGKEVRSKETWEKFLALKSIDNESPRFNDIDGDGSPEIICSTGGRVGYASIPSVVTEPWNFVPVSEPGPYEKFTHGIGIGDVNDDGKQDLLAKNGWWEQPADIAKTRGENWKFHPYAFTGAGGAQMHAVDLDGDKKTEVITSLQAHSYGLSVFKKKTGEEFDKIDIMTDKAETSPTQLAISQLHAVEMGDINRDGVADIITGKRFWAHQGHDPGENEPVLLVWFETKQINGGLRFIPHIVDEDCGVGTQITVTDINGDGKLDIFNASKRGVQAFIQTDTFDPYSVEKKSEQNSAHTAKRADSFVKVSDELGGYRPADDEKSPLNFDFEEATLKDWTPTGAAFFKQPVFGDLVHARRNDSTSDQNGSGWIGGFEVVGDIATGTLTSRAFKVSYPWASFLIAGGNKPETSVELVDADSKEIIARVSGTETETLKRAVVDLSKHLNKHIFIRLVDNQTTGWGHLNFDDFRLHSERPVLTPDKTLSFLDAIQHERLSPDKAAQVMQLPPDFAAQVIAAEPDVQQPIAMTIDHRGRLWIAEAYEYPRRASKDEGKDRILILEDTDSNGSLDKRTVFCEGLNLVSGLEVGHGGVWVGAAPYLLFIPDRDGDDKPDSKPEIKLDGWGLQDTHETLNSFIWGPDGWLYGCHGVFTHSNVGAPNTPDDQRTKINAGIWRYHPTESRFEVFAYGTSNPWGVDFNDKGQAFLTACVIPHLYHVIQGARYQRQAGNHFDPYTFDDIKTIAKHRHWVGANPHGGNNRSDSAGGGHAHSGAMVYLGGSWPNEYHNQLFMNNIHGARLNQDQLTAQGSGYTGDRAPDFLITNDRSSQILYFRSGPDGQVYAIDWYDIQQCHTTNPADHDRGNGRVYRISYKNAPPVKIDMNSWSDDKLIASLKDKNDWIARTARRLLAERSVQKKLDKTSGSKLIEMFNQSTEVNHRLQSLWTLSACNLITPAVLNKALSDSDPYVVGWAIQIIGQTPSLQVASFLPMFTNLAKSHPSQVVRLYLSSICQTLPPVSAAPILSQLLQHSEDANDHNLPLMYWYALSRIISKEGSLTSSLIDSTAIDSVRRYAFRQMIQSNDPKRLDEVVQWIAKQTKSDSTLLGLQELVKGLESQSQPKPSPSWLKLRDTLLNHQDKQISELVIRVAAKYRDPVAVDKLRSTALDSKQPVPNRQSAIKMLREVQDSNLQSIVVTLLDQESVRPIALAALADVVDATIANKVLQQCKSWSESDRRLSLYALLGRVETAKLVVDALEQKALEPKDISADMIAQMTNLPKFDDQERLSKVWGSISKVNKDTEAEIVRLKKELTSNSSKGNLQTGKQLFAKTCGQCHRLFAEGGNIGPELTGSNRRDLDYLLGNILAPSSVMAKEYQPWIVVTEDGRVVTGLLKAKTEESIQIQTATELTTVYTQDIDEMKQSEKSMMPENLLATLTPGQIRDLVAYLQSETPSQTVSQR